MGGALALAALTCIADSPNGANDDPHLLSDGLSIGLWYDLAALDALEDVAAAEAESWLVRSMSQKLVLLSSIDADVSALPSDGLEALCLIGSSDDLVTDVSALLQDESIAGYLERVRTEVHAKIRENQALFGGSGCSTSDPKGELFSH